MREMLIYRLCVRIKRCQKIIKKRIAQKGKKMEATKTESMKVLNLEEMENVAGGIIVRAGGKYWVMPDPNEYYGIVCTNMPFDSLDEAQARARMAGWSAKVYTREEYEETFH